jgi:hypothetical protein
MNKFSEAKPEEVQEFILAGLSSGLKNAIDNYFLPAVVVYDSPEAKHSDIIKIEKINDSIPDVVNQETFSKIKPVDFLFKDLKDGDNSKNTAYNTYFDNPFLAAMTAFKFLRKNFWLCGLGDKELPRWCISWLIEPTFDRDEYTGLWRVYLDFRFEHVAGYRKRYCSPETQKAD